MAAFSSSSDRSSDSGKHGSRESALSIIAPGTRITGELVTDGVVKIEGIVDGTIRAQREVLVAKGGRVQGDIHTRDVVVGGEVVGSIFADERVEVQPGSAVHGDIASKKLIIQEGGEVNGQVRMGDPKAVAPAANGTSS
ncbi:MAG: polymer-forming cytoskeletal protein [Gemmatimonadales bacterium]|jgi:cytoskeletal protein CcmA (bactofilin family)|nr:polymer-forming cytoskeletal protein [Gemmatimonadales bacterium]